MKTKAQQLGITDFPYEERDKNGYVTYWENSYGDWELSVVNDVGNVTYHESSGGYSWNSKFDNDGNEIYCDYNDGTKEYCIK